VRRFFALVALVTLGTIEDSIQLLGSCAMPIWRLTPHQLTSPCWVASQHTDIALIRAATEREAREAAMQAFGREVPDIPWHANPWRQLALVTCEPLHTSGYPETGPPAILEPPGYSCWIG
jgi:hypothetical protein